MLEAAVGPHALVQRILACMSERRVAEVVGERDRLDEVLVDAQVARNAPRDLCHLERVREARAEQIALVIHEHLRLVFEPAKRGAVDDAVAVALEFGARRLRWFGMLTATRLRGKGAVRREVAGVREHQL